MNVNMNENIHVKLKYEGTDDNKLRAAGSQKSQVFSGSHATRAHSLKRAKFPITILVPFKKY